MILEILRSVTTSRVLKHYPKLRELLPQHLRALEMNGVKTNLIAAFYVFDVIVYEDSFGWIDLVSRKKNIEKIGIRLACFLVS